MNQFIGQEAPNFEATTVFPNNKITTLNLKDYLKDSKGVLFFYPLDFTFVCPSEIIAFNNRSADFEKRGVKIIAVSIDSHFSHHMWRSMPPSKGGIGDVNFPLVSDIKKEISNAYSVLNSDGVSYRATFLIDEKFNIRHYLVNDLPLGRNVDETVRMIDALDHHNKHGEVCPAGWQREKPAMIATQDGVSDYLISNADKL